MKKYKMTSAQVIALGFLITIFIGMVLLLLPFATVKGENTGVLDALFTSTTSVCVTGLTVVDTYAHWSLFGKLVILVLIQIGGLGIVSITTLFMFLFRQKFTLKNSMLVQDAFNLNTKHGLLEFTIRVLKGTLLIELIGAVLCSFSFCKEYGMLRGIWYSVFHSVSAFCNAGIDVLGPDSLMQYYSNPLLLLTTAFLVIMGGIGFVVWWDFLEIFEKIRKKKIRFSMLWDNIQLQTKLVVVVTIFLLVLGSLVILLLEWKNPETIGNYSTGDKVLNAFFESVTLRTSGFVTFSQQGLHEATALLCLAFMFIGGSPVGTAGGVKTVTLAIAFLTFISLIRERDEITVFKRKIPLIMVKKAVTIVFISMGATIVMTILLLATNELSLVDGLFEVMSATSTVGLPRGITPSLNTFGRIIIMISMFIGRIGPISVVVTFHSQDSRSNLIHYPEENVIVG